jgi:hypothetical protein
MTSVQLAASPSEICARFQAAVYYCGRQTMALEVELVAARKTARKSSLPPNIKLPPVKPATPREPTEKIAEVTPGVPSTTGFHHYRRTHRGGGSESPARHH